MNERIWQAALLAQGDDVGGWMNILFIVVVAVFWAVGGLVKAAGAKSKDRRQGATKSSERPATSGKRETWLQQLAKKAEEIQRAMEPQSSQGARRPAQTKPQTPARPGKPPGGRVAVRTGRGGESVLVYERQGRQPPAERKQQRVRQRPAHPSAVGGRPAEERQPTRAPAMAADAGIPVMTAPSEKPSPAPGRARRPAYISSPLADFSDADALKRAILHYEILGKPLAFRDPFERTSSF